ncbi:hypothetical protein JTB14_018462 [Gonioctena quinquepunctata]|nr:hypothetical protein JTB14_018462 [Gonioctena quinquepunctata]
MWDLDNPKHAEAAMEFFHNIPDDKTNSNQDSDDAADEEKELLECTTTSTPSSSTRSSINLDIPQNSPVTAEVFSSESSPPPSSCGNFDGEINRTWCQGADDSCENDIDDDGTTVFMENG